MAQPLANMSSGASRLAVTAPEVISLGNASDSTVGSKLFQVQGTFSITPQARFLGSAGLVTPIAVSYRSLASGNLVAAGTAITVNGIYSVEADVGIEVLLDFTSVTGTVILLHNGGKG